MDNKKTSDTRWQKNKEHWNEVATAKNLQSSAKELDWQKERELYRSCDVVGGYAFLEPLKGKTVVDLGGGVGLSAHDFLDRGALVLIVDVSIARCRLAQRRLIDEGFEGRIQCVVAEGQALPLLANSVDRLWTKSVLIHTPLKQTAHELARVLKPEGRGWFIEPMRRNPFVNLYRTLQAPRIWQEITTYFSPLEFKCLRREFTQKRFSSTLHSYYLFGFFAFVFSFLFSNPTLFRFTESVLMFLDSILWKALPATKRYAWFGALAVRPKTNVK